MARPDAPEPKRGVEPNVFVAVGAAGVALFLVGILPKLALARLAIPALALGYLELVVAASGGALAMFGFSKWYDLRKAEREGPPPTEDVESSRQRFGSSFEIYDPNADTTDRRRRKGRP